MNTHAVIATNHSHSYDLFAPICALFWREIVGFRTLVFLTGKQEEWQDPVSRLVHQACIDVGARVEFIGTLEGYRDGQAAQSARQHAAALDLPADDVLVTGDIDMLSLNQDWFRRHDLVNYDFCNTFADAYGWPHPPFLPTPYTYATVAKWREVMQLEVRGEILTQMQANFDRTLGRYHDSWTAWWQDEMYFNSKLREWGGWPKRVQMLTRPGCPPHDRIDRCNWPATFDWSKPWADTHVIRPAATKENWPRVRPLIEHYIPAHAGWVEKYVEKYQEARKYA